jgi:hypothetical protein
VASGKLGLGTESLFVAVGGVGEVDRSIDGVGCNVSGGIEWDAAKICEEHACLVGTCGGDVDEAGGFFERALRCEDETVAFGAGQYAGARGYVGTFGTSDFVPREVLFGVEFYFGDFGAFVGGGDGAWVGVAEEGGAQVEGRERRDEGSAMLEVGGAGVGYQEGEAGGGADVVGEGVSVDEEGLLIWEGGGLGVGSRGGC